MHLAINLTHVRYEPVRGVGERHCRRHGIWRLEGLHDMMMPYGPTLGAICCRPAVHQLNPKQHGMQPSLPNAVAAFLCRGTRGTLAIPWFCDDFHVPNAPPLSWAPPPLAVHLASINLSIHHTATITPLLRCSHRVLRCVCTVDAVVPLYRYIDRTFGHYHLCGTKVTTPSELTCAQHDVASLGTRTEQSN
jgi:hypothetical protein